MEYLERRKNPCNKLSLKRKILAMFGIKIVYVSKPASVGVHEEEGTMDVSLNYRHSLQLRNTLIEVEHKKAKAIIEIERQRMRML